MQAIASNNFKTNNNENLEEYDFCQCRVKTKIPLKLMGYKLDMTN